MPRGRKRNIDKTMYFNANAYIHDLQRGLKAATYEIADMLSNQAIKNLSKVPVKNNVVRVINGGNFESTSDAERIGAVIKSIGRERVEFLRRGLLQTAIHAIDRANFTESHVGIYYEFGTGEKAQIPPAGMLPAVGELGTANKYRTGKSIVSRSKHIDYCGMGKGIWKDMGGNLRKTFSQKAGERTPGFVKYVGLDVKAYSWYRNACGSMSKRLFKEIIWKHIGNIHPANYLMVQSRITVG